MAVVSNGRTTRSAECEQCIETRGDGDVRGWAARHADRTGHTVYVLAERGTYFRPDTPPTNHP